MHFVRPTNESFRVFLSSDPANSIPIGLLERCIKLTNEPPSGLKANLKRAFCSFGKEDFEDMEPRTKVSPPTRQSASQPASQLASQGTSCLWH